MADKTQLIRLADDIRSAIHSLDENDKNGWIRVQGSLEALRRATEPPQVFIMKQRFHTVQNVCIIMAIEMGLLSQLCTSPGRSLDAAELSQSTGFDKVLIVRIMRMMAAIGFVDETDHQAYQANAATHCQDDPGSCGGLVLSNEMIFPCGNIIRQYLRQNKPCTQGQMPAAYDSALKESVWQTLQNNAEWKKGFDDNMTARNKLYSMPWHVKFPAEQKLSGASPASEASDRPIIVDVGGNQGVDLQRFAEHLPKLQCTLILQDLPETLNGIHGFLDPRIKLTAYDFFTEQPVKGADIYYFKSVLHDWDDASSRKILSQTARAMNKRSRLLINEMVLADRNETLVRADMDMLMFFISNGMERSRTQWKDLLASVSPPLKLIDVWSAPGDQQSVMEISLAD